ncbi:MAG: hypothetical protein ACREQR_11320 [Candidatus Binataceae bacterium]
MTFQRFISEDPERGKVNLFSYAGNNAITGSDISGMDPGCDYGCGEDASAGAGKDNGPAFPFADLLEVLANILFQDSSEKPPPNFDVLRHKLQASLSAASTGTDNNANIHTTGGEIIFIPANTSSEPGELMLLDKNGKITGDFPAANNFVRGTKHFPVGNFGFAYHNAHSESGPHGPFGSHGIFVFDVPGRIHSGRSGPLSKTQGCIRTTESATQTLCNNGVSSLTVTPPEYP